MALSASVYVAAHSMAHYDDSLPHDQRRWQFGLRTMLLATAAVSAAMAWCVTFSEVLGRSYFGLAAAMVFIVSASWAAGCGRSAVSAACLLALGWLLSLCTATLDITYAFQGPPPNENVIYNHIYLAVIGGITLPLLGTLAFVVVADLRPYAFPGRRYLLAAITVGVFDLMAFLLLSQPVLEHLDRILEAVMGM